MALPTNITTLLTGGVVEWARIEFKTTWDPEASLKTICAFANDIENWGGGYLVIGVSQADDGTPREIVGVPPQQVDTYLKDMLNACKRIQPSYMPITEIAEHEGKKLIVIWAPGGSTRPYSSPKHMGKKTERVRWIRTMASTIKPSHEQECELYNLANNVPFDDRVNHVAELSDLSLPLIKSYLREVGSSLYQHVDTADFVTICQSMNIAEGPREYVRPKNVGLLFFSMEPEKWFPYAQIDIVELPEGEGGDIIRERTFRGPIHQQLRDALQFLHNGVIEEYVVKTPDKAESDRHFNYPYAALEEALSNAVYHKGYDSREPIEVRILPDRIEILSHPGADRSISIENLKEFRAVSRRYRNRRVGEFLKELRLTEGRNTGFQKILRALHENGSPEPLFETDEERIYFLVTIYARKDTEGSSAMLHSSATLNQSRDSAIEARKASILDFIAAHPDTSIEAMCQKLGLKRSTTDRDIRTLKSEGKLERIGAPRAGSWRVLP